MMVSDINIEDCFSDKLGYGPAFDAKAICLKVSNSIGAIEKAQRMSKNRHDDIDLGDRKIDRLREPVFISEIKTLLGMF